MTNRVKHLFSYSFFISVCAVAMCWETGMLLSIPISNKVLVIVFFACLFTYNLYSVAGFVVSNKHLSIRQKSSLLNFRQIISMVLILTSGLIVFFIATSLTKILPLLFYAAALSLLYFNFVFKIRKRNFWWNNAFIKPFLLAATWALVTVFFPLYEDFHFSFFFLTLLYLHRFLFILLLCLIFDNKDIDNDRKNGIKTLANTLTKVHLKLAYYLVLLAYMLSTIGLDCLQISHSQTCSLLLIGIACSILFVRPAEKNGYYFYYFWVDGMMLFSAFAVYLTTI